MYLTLPIPAKGNSKVTLQQCLDAFVKEEVMEKSDAWLVLPLYRSFQ
jgi:ubiquitin carboxyl-terminal hydrolase 8